MSSWSSILHISLLSLVAIPVYVKQSISFFETGPCGRLDITIGPKQTMGKTVEALMVTIHMPKAVLSANLTATQGTYTYDLATKVTADLLGNKVGLRQRTRSPRNEDVTLSLSTDLLIHYPHSDIVFRKTVLHRCSP